MFLLFHPLYHSKIKKKSFYFLKANNSSYFIVLLKWVYHYISILQKLSMEEIHLATNSINSEVTSNDLFVIKVTLVIVFVGGFLISAPN